MKPPSYFEQVRAEAAKVWEAWQDPQVGGPAKQLFRQVQSPKHVLSELLQNADDAEAKQARASLEGSRFTFFHDGLDFDQDQFRSLCSFAHSNKRTIHTIGFRGIGFKSTFSLGNAVEVLTPTLSVRFNKEKFTYPEWIETALAPSGTYISVPDVSPLVQGALLQNCKQWAEEPFSLLFLKNLRKLSLPDREVHWEPDQRASFGDSQWFHTQSVGRSVLLCRSAAEHFPQDSLDEIKQERNLDESELEEFPPCSVELVIGAPGRLYVVLPTGVELDLGFAVNAPFIQDPSRFVIKSPSTSATNRWLLERAGIFAAESMLSWLKDESLSMLDRAEAYALMPKRPDGRASLADECLAAIAEAFWKRLAGEAYILSTSGDLAEPADAVLLPQELAGVWPDTDYAQVSGFEQYAVVAWEVARPIRALLKDQAHVPSVSLGRVAERLVEFSPPKPATMRQLEKLWLSLNYQLQNLSSPQSVHIVPVEDSNSLATAVGTLRPPACTKAIAADDWKRLLRGSPRLCSEWIAHLEALEQQSESDRESKNDPSKLVDLLDLLDLSEPTEISRVAELACQHAIKKDLNADHWKWLAEVHAALGIRASSSLHYEVRNGQLIRDQEGLRKPLFDALGVIGDFFPEEALNARVLSPRYHQSGTIPQEDWIRWLTSTNSGVATWVSPDKVEKEHRSKTEFEADLPDHLRKRVVYEYVSKRYYTKQRYKVIDHKFSQPSKLSDELFEEFLRWNVAQMARVDSKEWKSMCEAQGFQTPSNGGEFAKVKFEGDTSATWIRQLQTHACLPDSRGVFRKPHELYLRSETTRPLQEYEPFIAEELDTEQSRELLLTLGVLDSPRDVNAIVNRLRMLSQAQDPPQEELQKLYSQIDRSLPSLSWDPDQFTGGRAELIKTFRAEPLIFTEAHGWQKSGDVFITAGAHDLPDVPVVHPTVASLRLWSALEVKPEPKWDDVLAWVSSLPKRSALDQATLKRLQKCLVHDSDGIWELGGWLNVAGEWVDHDDLEFALSQSSFKPSEIVPRVQRRTADFTMVKPKQADLLNLEAAAEHRISAVQPLGAPAAIPDWLLTVAEHLAHVKIHDAESQARTRNLAKTLARSSWQRCDSITSLPYLDDAPLIITSQELSVHWDVEQAIVYSTPMDEATEADELAKILAREFVMPELEKALNFCYERPHEQIVNCLSRHFKFDANETTSTIEPTEDLPEAEESPAAPEEFEGVAMPAQPYERTATPRTERPATRIRQNKLDHPSGLIEEYAYRNGFEAVSQTSFFKKEDHVDHVIRRVENKEFPWEYTVDGRVIRRIYSVNAHLGSPKIELTYEQWEMIHREAKLHALLVLDENNEPSFIGGQRLVDAVRSGDLDLRISKYRLVERQ
jgi:hypothetical protein